MNTYNLAKSIGFNNINIDLILGIPNQSLDEMKESLNKVINLKPNHISIYSLILEEGTKLEEMINEGKLKMIDEEEERKMYWETKQILEKNGYIHYEISNFARLGYESKHNLACWNQEEYIGFGVSAHSYLNKTRYSNLENIEEYIYNIKTKEFGKNKIIHEMQTEMEKRKRIYATWFKKNRRS